MLDQLEFWRLFEESVLRSFTIALISLQQEAILPEREDDLNRKLYKKLPRSIRECSIELDRKIQWSPFYEANNQPILEDEERAVREGKRPDFQCQIVDHTEPNLDKCLKIFTVECKRLGNPPSPNWILNENYILNGIMRFIDVNWGYGASFKSGAMIGYVQSMELYDILVEVNGHATDNNINELELSELGWQAGDVSILAHEIERPHTQPNPFKLNHLWIDLRVA